VAHIAVELDERARIEQLDQALARKQLPLLVLALDCLLACSVLRLVAQLQEVVELRLRRFGAVVRCRHGRTLVWLRVDEFRLLGPVEAMVDGTPVRLAAAKPRALLALLLLARNRVVATERLIDELWGDEPPAQATKTLQVYVSQLRKSLGPERLVTQPPGYLLRVEPGELDWSVSSSLPPGTDAAAGGGARHAEPRARALARCARARRRSPRGAPRRGVRGMAPRVG
jgi:hypothetical protein